MPYCSNGSNCLLYYIACFCISKLPWARHFWYKGYQYTTSNDNGRNAWKKDKGKKPSFHKSNNKTTEKCWNELYELPNLSCILMKTVKELKEGYINGKWLQLEKKKKCTKTPLSLASIICIDTFSPIASWMRMVSPDILSMTSPVEISVSKKAMSCLSIVLKYKPRMRVACLAPVTIQHDTSAIKPRYQITITLQRTTWN